MIHQVTMKRFVLPLLLCIPFFYLAGCCDPCDPDFTQAELDQVPHPFASFIRFSNGAGQERVFRVMNQNVDPGHEKDCGSGFKNHDCTAILDQNWAELTESGDTLLNQGAYFWTKDTKLGRIGTPQVRFLGLNFSARTSDPGPTDYRNGWEGFEEEEWVVNGQVYGPVVRMTLDTNHISSNPLEPLQMRELIYSPEAGLLQFTTFDTEEVYRILP